MSSVLTIGELAMRAGVATSALRYYEGRGLIRAERTSAGHRRYSSATTQRVVFIGFAQRVGLSLEEIRIELEKLPADWEPTHYDWGSLLQTWSARISDRIVELERIKLGLADCIGDGLPAQDEDAILGPHDCLADHGPDWGIRARFPPSVGPPPVNLAPGRPEPRPRREP